MMRNKKIACYMVILLCMPGSVLSMGFFNELGKFFKSMSTNFATEFNQLLAADEYPSATQDLDNMENNQEQKVEEPNASDVVLKQKLEGANASCVVPIVLKGSSQELVHVPKPEDDRAGVLTEFHGISSWLLRAYACCVWQEQTVNRGWYGKSKTPAWFQEITRKRARHMVDTKSNRRLITASSVTLSSEKIIKLKRTPGSKVGQSLYDSTFDGDSADEADDESVRDMSVPKVFKMKSHESVANLNTVVVSTVNEPGAHSRNIHVESLLQPVDPLDKFLEGWVTNIPDSLGIRLEQEWVTISPLPKQ